jgi:hypothetical protein
MSEKFISTHTRWIAEEEIKDKKERNVVLNARKLESERLEKGWRYFRISNNMTILVPCDKKGNPTKEGLKRIEERKKSLLML